MGRWWEQILHNQSALRLKSSLHFMPGVMVASVPWQLRSSVGREDRDNQSAPGDIRRGAVPSEEPAEPDPSTHPITTKESSS